MKNNIKDALENIFLGSFLKCHRMNLMYTRFVKKRIRSPTVLCNRYITAGWRRAAVTLRNDPIFIPSVESKNQIPALQKLAAVPELSDPGVPSSDC